MSARATLLLTALFVAASLGHVAWRLDGVGQHYEVSVAQASPAIHGTQAARCDFVPPRDSVERLSLFMVSEERGRAQETRAVLTLRDVPGGRVVGQVERMVPAPGHPWREDLQFEPDWTVTAGQLYRLELSLPDAGPAQALRLHMSESLDGGTTNLRVGEQALDGQSLDFLSFSERPRFPTALVALGLALLALAIRRCPSSHRDGETDRLSSASPLLVTLGLAAATSVFVWESAVWRFYGEYWPDGKVYLAQLLKAALDNPQSWSETWSLVSGHLHGATPLVPLLLAALHWLGLPLLYGYTLLSLLFGAGTLALVSRFLRQHSDLSPRQIALVVAMTGCHFVVLRGVVRPQTDGAGVFFTLLFVSALVDLTAASTTHARRYMAAVSLPVILVLGLLARIALLPLLLVPLAMAGWQALTSRGSTERPAMLAPLLAAVAGCALLAGTYQGLDLWGSLAQLRSTADRPEFRTLTLSSWATHSAMVAQLALPLVLLCWRRATSDHGPQVLLLTTAGFLAMLLVFQVIPWYRYWAPISPLVMVLSGYLLFDGVRAPGAWRYTLGALTIVGNLAWVAIQKSY